MPLSRVGLVRQRSMMPVMTLVLAGDSALPVKMRVSSSAIAAGVVWSRGSSSKAGLGWLPRTPNEALSGAAANMSIEGPSGSP